jgi:hypothetical protein
MKRLPPKTCDSIMKNLQHKPLRPAGDRSEQWEFKQSFKAQPAKRLQFPYITPRCFSVAYFLRVFTGRTSAGHDARSRQKFSQRPFAGVCNHKTLMASVRMMGFNCRIERARAADQCPHGLTQIKNQLVRNPAWSGCWIISIDSNPHAKMNGLSKKCSGGGDLMNAIDSFRKGPTGSIAQTPMTS